MEAVVIAVLALGLAGQNEVEPAFYGCETVDRGGYLIFADPTCPAEAFGHEGPDETATLPWQEEE